MTIWAGDAREGQSTENLTEIGAHLCVQSESLAAVGVLQRLFLQVMTVGGDKSLLKNQQISSKTFIQERKTTKTSAWKHATSDPFLTFSTIILLEER